MKLSSAFCALSHLEVATDFGALVESLQRLRRHYGVLRRCVVEPGQLMADNHVKNNMSKFTVSIECTLKIDSL